MFSTTFNVRGRCFVCEGRFIDPYRLVCYKDQCRGRIICGSCLGIANDAFHVGMKCSICRINSIISIVPIGSVEIADQDEITRNNSAMKEQSPLEIEMRPLQSKRSRKPTHRYMANTNPSRTYEKRCDGCKGNAKIRKCGVVRSNKACGKCISVGIPCVFNGQVLEAMALSEEIKTPLPKKYKIITVHSDSDETETDEETKKALYGEFSDDDDTFLKNDA